MARKWSLLAGWVIVTMGVTGFSGSPGASQQVPEAFQYVYVLIVLGIAVLVGILLWWWLDVRSRPKEVAPQVAKEIPQPVSEVAAAVADDLTRIEGIGPKISGLLQEAGIRTFADLAAANVDRLREILTAAGLTALADPGTWPEQASLAAQGQWERLEALQNELKGGSPQIAGAVVSGATRRPVPRREG